MKNKDKYDAEPDCNFFPEEQPIRTVLNEVYNFNQASWGFTREIIEWMEPIDQ